jgi:hypothetical protein
MEISQGAPGLKLEEQVPPVFSEHPGRGIFP